jgi:hypothetical protein
MAANNRGNRGGNRRQAGPNNNPEGRNQYSGSPLGKAAAIGGAVAAGIFLWKRRDQISEQLSTIAEQIGEWRDGMNDEATLAADSPASDDQRSQLEIAEEALTLKELGTVS